MSHVLHNVLRPSSVIAPGGVPPLFVRPVAPVVAPTLTRRTKIWEFSNNLDCSLVGTCLSTADLRQILGKLGLVADGVGDHELHHVAVATAGRHDLAAKLLNKALDTRHKLAIAQFAKARSESDLRGLWRDAVRRGDIPGAYWATLTHPAATQPLVREAFGEVHMLSHLVGAANRADIRRLRVLEDDKAALEDRLARQQIAFHKAVVQRDAELAALRQALTHRIVVEPQPGEARALDRLVSELQRRLATESRRRDAAEAKLTGVRTSLETERIARAEAESRARLLGEELKLVETRLQRQTELPQVHLDDLTVLYDGGHKPGVANLLRLGEEHGAIVLHHDGGIEDHPSLLPDMAGRAAVVLFPVDCVSHDAALAVKRVCRRIGKKFIPLRSSGATTFLAALHTLSKVQPPDRV